MATARPRTRPETHRQAVAIAVLYLFRAGFSGAWVVLVYTLSSSARGITPGVLAVVLLAIYPVSDVIATLFDLHATRAAPSKLPQYINIAAGITAACAIATCVSSTLPAAITVFGVWAIVAGAVQLILAIHRRTTLGGQWLMIVSGAGSVLAGITFIGWSGTSSTGLAVLAQYSAGGAIWYLLCAVWLLHMTRSPTTASPQPSIGP